MVAHLIEVGSHGLELMGNGGVLHPPSGQGGLYSQDGTSGPRVEVDGVSDLCLEDVLLLGCGAICVAHLLCGCYFTELATEIREGADDTGIGYYWGSLGSSFL